MYDQPSGRRFGPALIVFLVVLAAVSGTVGYFGAKNVLDSNATPTANGSPSAGRSSTAPGPSHTPTTGGGSPSPSSGSNSGPSSSSNSGQGGNAVKPGDPTKCPKATADAVAAAGFDDTLHVVLYIHTHQDGATDKEGWVCTNTDGLLIYQGHDLSGKLDKADNGVNTIMLAEGIKGTVADNGDEIVASNPGPNSTITEYHLSKAKLFVVTEPHDQNPHTYPVVNSYP